MPTRASPVPRRSPTGTCGSAPARDVAYFGGLINYVLQNDLIHKEYVEFATNAAFVVKEDYEFNDGLFNGYDPQRRVYNPRAWAYETNADGFAVTDINHPRSVLNLMRAHYSRYTPEMVERITGIPKDGFLEVAKLVGETGRPDKVMTIVYAVGLTHHTTGVQLIRSGARASTPARQHGTSGWRHERRARPRQHPRQHRPRDLVGHPARLPADPGARPAQPRRLSGAEREQEAARQRRELLRRRTTASSW